MARMEEEVLRACTHPNLVRLLDAKEENGRYLLMLEWIDGHDLDQISKWDLPIGTSLNIVRAVCGAVEALHAKGFVHGDISPANVISVAAPVCAKLIDLSTRNLDGRPCTYFYASTGTRGFKAPEKEDDFVRVVDRRVDIYSLGKLLEFLTSGVVSEAHTALRPQIDQVIIRACAYSPADRYQNISDMLAALPSP